MPTEDYEDLDELYASNVIEAPVLDCVNMPVTQTFAPSTAYNQPLTSLFGQVAFAFVTFRASIANASAGARTFANIGNTAQVELLDEPQCSRLSNPYEAQTSSISSSIGSKLQQSQSDQSRQVNNNLFRPEIQRSTSSRPPGCVLGSLGC